MGPAKDVLRSRLHQNLNQLPIMPLLGIKIQIGYLALELLIMLLQTCKIYLYTQIMKALKILS